MILDDVGELVYRKFLRSVSWNMFDHVMTLGFSDGENDLEIVLKGVCAVVSRQQADSSIPLPLGPECEVQYAAVIERSDFVDRLIANELGLETETFVYDAGGRNSESPEFVRPHHLALSCDAGNLDIAFRECELHS